MPSRAEEHGCRPRNRDLKQLLVRECARVYLDRCVDDGRLAPVRERVCDRLATGAADDFGARRNLGGIA